MTDRIVMRATVTSITREEFGTFMMLRLEVPGREETKPNGQLPTNICLPLKDSESAAYAPGQKFGVKLVDL